MGTNKLSSGGARYSASKIIVHEKYNRSVYAYDFALVSVQTSIEFNAKVQPIKYSARVIEPGTDLKVTGWGILSRVGYSRVICFFGVQKRNSKCLKFKFIAGLEKSR